MKKSVQVVLVITVWSFAAWVYFDIKKDNPGITDQLIHSIPDPLSEKLIKSVLGPDVEEVIISDQSWQIRQKCAAASICITNAATALEKLGRWAAPRNDIEVPSRGFIVDSYIKIVDKYGNRSNALAFKLQLKKLDTDKANWKNMNMFLVLNLTKITILKQFYKKTAHEYCFRESWAGRHADIIPAFCEQVLKK
jgi:hypothetical protein